MAKTAPKAAAAKKSAAKKTAIKKTALKKLVPKQAIAKLAAASAKPTPLLQKLRDCLDDAKAENIVALDLQGRSSIADYMVVATGRSTTHVAAIADRVLKMCKEAGFGAPRVEGIPHCDWVLVDAGDVIVHVFRPEVREFYNLEKMWGGDRPADTSPSHAGRA